ncbi:flagellar filament capping protein FliD [Paenibacillus lautus]|uniref:flagellar filament capping protein FliD n=1 Tax=Paenibacillus lautus TaxID=1401 RepID=UPI002DBEF9D2|nr:flagellar filament capping protein FliD [Paenibacillus lautus]MEC0207171.1 flagellar filament capping protein FliD [Paenibacillus lautus]
MTIRISGMASGMDIDKIVTDLMRAEKLPAQKLYQKKQSLIWSRDEYRNVNKTLSQLMNSADKLRFSTNFSKLSASSSNESVVSATVKSGAKAASYSVQVNKLATSATLIGDELPVGTKFDETILANGTITISNGTTDKDIQLGSKTIKSVLTEISNSGLGVRASYDTKNNRITLVSETMGEKSQIELTGDTTALGFANGVVNKGNNAEVLVNGQSISISNNNLELDGVSLSLKGVSSSPVVVNVSKDISAVKNTIMDFVNLYNDTIDKLRSKTSETLFRDYKPLTDEEKSGMTEKQIELWESKAKSGLLRNDSIIEETIYSLRNALAQGLESTGSFKSLSDIGIDFKSFLDGGVTELGKLKIDESKLEQAIIDHPDEIVNLFTQVPTADKSNPKERFAQTGFADRIYQTLQTQSSKISKKIGNGTNSEAVDNSYYGNLLKDLNSKILSMDDRLERIETRYYKQFTAMEKAIQQLNSQGSWLSQQLG